MCRVIITCWSLLWTLLSIGTLMMMLTSAMSPQWLLGQSREAWLASQPTALPGYVWVGNGSVTSRNSGSYRPSVGLINRCTVLRRHDADSVRPVCAVFVTSPNMPDDDWPHCWKASVAFFALSLLLLLTSSLFAVASLCVRSVCGKSIFTVAGLLQALAGLLAILGLVLYPGGWGSRRVRNLCGDHASPFVVEQCSLGWAFYVAMGATLLAFLCSVLGVKADRATSSHKVEEEVLEGNHIICVM